MYAPKKCLIVLYSTKRTFLKPIGMKIKVEMIHLLSILVSGKSVIKNLMGNSHSCLEQFQGKRVHIMEYIIASLKT